jgi:hypothetical protein
MTNIVDKLRGGDLRSIGRSDEVAQHVTKNSKLFAEVLAAILDNNPVIRMRAADAIEKAPQLIPNCCNPTSASS